MPSLCMWQKIIEDIQSDKMFSECAGITGTMIDAITL